MSETELLAQGLSNLLVDTTEDDKALLTSADATNQRHTTGQTQLERSISEIANLVNSAKLTVGVDNIYGGSGGFTAIPSTPVAQGTYFQVRKLQRTEHSTAAKYPRQVSSDRNGSFSGLIDIEAVKLEVQALSHPPIHGHPNIISLIGLSWARLGAGTFLSLPILYLEFASLGTLSQYLSDHKVSPRQKLVLADEIASGLDVLHACGITHGDLKLENVLMFHGKNHGIVAKIADFGCSTRMREDGWQLRGGTQPWNAPEWRTVMPIYLLHKTDIYSLGLLIWRMFLDGNNPFGVMTSEDIESRKARGLTLLDANHSLEQSYRLYSCLNDAAAESEVFDDYLFMVALPQEAMEASLIAEPERRNLLAVKAALSEKVELGLEKPSQIGISAKTFYTPGSAQNHYLQLFDSPNYVRRMHLQQLEQKVQDQNASKPERSDLCLQLVFANLDGFVDYRDPYYASKWLVEAAEMGNLPAQEASYRILEACKRMSSNVVSVSREKLCVWLQKAAAAGSNVAREDLRLLNPEAARETLAAWRDRVVFKPMMETFSEDMLQSITSQENVLSLAEQARSLGDLGGVAGLRLDKQLNTMCHYAAVLAASVEDFQVCLTLFDDLSVKNKAGDTALHLAMAAGNVMYAEQLLRHGASVNIKNKKGQMPHHWIVYIPQEAGCMQLLKLFLDRNVDFEAVATVDKERQEYRHDHRRGTLLELAVIENRMDIVREQLKRGADPTVSSRSWNAALQAISLHRWHMLGQFLPYIKGRGLTLQKVLQRRENARNAAINQDLACLAVGGSPIHNRIILHGTEYELAFEKTMQVLFRAKLLPPDLSNAMYYAACVNQTDQLETLARLHWRNPGSQSAWRMSIFERSVPRLGQLAALTLLAGVSESMLRTRLEQTELLHSYIQSLTPTPLVLEILLRASGSRDLDRLDDEGRSLFTHAVDCSQYEIATHLLSKGVKAKALVPDRTAVDRNQRTVNCVHNLIARDCDLTVYPLRYLLETLHPYEADVPDFVVAPRLKLTALHGASKWNAEPVFDYVLSKYHEQEHLSATAINGWTALHFAANNGNLHAVLRLCDYKVPLNIPATKAYGFQTPLDICASTSRLATNMPRTEDYWERFMVGRLKVWLHLRSMDARHSTLHRRPADVRFLMHALREGWCQLMTEALQAILHRTDKTLYVQCLNAALQKASQAGHVALVEKLVTLGANINDRTHMLRTPLHNAVRAGHPRLVHALVMAGADQSARDEKGRTPVIEAFVKDDAGLVKYLVQAGSPADFPRSTVVDMNVRLGQGQGDGAAIRVEKTRCKAYFLEWKEWRDGRWHYKDSVWTGRPLPLEEGILRARISELDDQSREYEEAIRQRQEKRRFSQVWSRGNVDKSDKEAS